ncbi:hypothetical protein L208DRAFT_1244211, partial [Tricholoma matsutake]
GLHIAQVCVLFNLPCHFGQLSQPLAYVEWFTPLGNPDPITGMYLIKRSMCTHHRNTDTMGPAE